MLEHETLDFFFLNSNKKCIFDSKVYSFNFCIWWNYFFYTHRCWFFKKEKSNKSVQRIIFCILRIQSFSVCCLFPVGMYGKRREKKKIICLHSTECFGKIDLLCFVYRFVFCFFFAHNCLWSMYVYCRTFNSISTVYREKSNFFQLWNLSLI